MRTAELKRLEPRTRTRAYSWFNVRGYRRASDAIHWFVAALIKLFALPPGTRYEKLGPGLCNSRTATRIQTNCAPRLRSL